MPVHLARPEHEVTYQEIADLIKRHAEGLSAQDVLAVAANMVGKLVAMQDQRTISVEVAMDVVMRNIEAGNQQVVAQLNGAPAMGRG